MAPPAVLPLSTRSRTDPPPTTWDPSSAPASAPRPSPQPTAPYLNQLLGERAPLIFGNLDGGDHPVPLPSPGSGASPRELLRDWGGEAGEGAAHRVRAQGRGMGGQRYLGGASAPHGNRCMVWPASGIPGGASKCPTHPPQPLGCPVLLRPVIRLPGSLGPSAASGAGCERRWGSGWLEREDTRHPAPPLPTPSLRRGISPGMPGARRGFGAGFGFVLEMTGNSWAGRALPQPSPPPPTHCVTPLGAPSLPRAGCGAQYGHRPLPQTQDHAASPALDARPGPRTPSRRQD